MPDLNNDFLLKYKLEYLIRNYLPTLLMKGKSKNPFEVIGYPLGESLIIKECGYNIKNLQSLTFTEDGCDIDYNQIVVEFIILKNNKLSFEEHKNTLLKMSLSIYQIIWENIDKYYYHGKDYVLVETNDDTVGFIHKNITKELFNEEQLESNEIDPFNIIFKNIQPIKINYFLPYTKEFESFKLDKLEGFMGFNRSWDDRSDKDTYYTINAVIEVNKKILEKVKKGIFMNFLIISNDTFHIALPKK